METLFIVYFWILFYFGVKSYFLNKKHLLLLLLSLEYLSLMILLMMVYFLHYFSMDFYMIMYMIVVMVCEAVIGLTILTVFVRAHGSDFMKTLFVMNL